MTDVHPRRRATVLSSRDLTGGRQLLVHSCEDCACPVSNNPTMPDPVPLLRSIPDGGPVVRAREVLEIPLDREHWVLFNPCGAGGATVVNGAAREILDHLRRPATPEAVRGALGDAIDDLDEGLRRLIRSEMILPVGGPQRPGFDDSTVLTAWLHVTNACNLRCPYCYVHKSAERMDEAVGPAAVAAIFRSAVAHGFPAVKLKYAGGEASLNSALLLSLHAQARTLADQHGVALSATLLTNGVSLTRALVETLRSAGVRIMTSLDGIGDRHNAQRPFVNGRPSFDRVDRTISQLIEQGHPPHLSVTITNRNAAGVADVVRYALERDLTFSLNFFRDNQCSAGVTDLRYGEGEMISAVLDAFAVIEEFLPPWSVLGCVLDRGQLLQPRLRSCGVGRDYVVIDQRGGVAKCHMEIERTLGSVLRDDPLQLVRADRRTIANLPVEEKEGCRDCTWRYWCTGGCSVATFRATGRYDVKSPNCGIYKAIYPQALRLEGLRLLKHAGTG
jgi:uncharacterized protein